MSRGWWRSIIIIKVSEPNFGFNCRIACWTHREQQGQCTGRWDVVKGAPGGAGAT